MGVGGAPPSPGPLRRAPRRASGSPADLRGREPVYARDANRGDGARAWYAARYGQPQLRRQPAPLLVARRPTDAPYPRPPAGDTPGLGPHRDVGHARNLGRRARPVGSGRRLARGTLLHTVPLPPLLQSSGAARRAGSYMRGLDAPVRHHPVAPRARPRRRGARPVPGGGSAHQDIGRGPAAPAAAGDRDCSLRTTFPRGTGRRPGGRAGRPAVPGRAVHAVRQHPRRVRVARSPANGRRRGAPRPYPPKSGGGMGDGALALPHAAHPPARRSRSVGRAARSRGALGRVVGRARQSADRPRPQQVVRAAPLSLYRRADPSARRAGRWSSRP